MKAANLNQQSDISSARSLAVMSLIGANNRRVLGKVKLPVLKKKRTPFFTFPISWFAVLLGLFIFQAYGADLSQSGKNVLYKFSEPDTVTATDIVTNNEQSSKRLTVTVKLSGADIPFELGYQLFPDWQLSFESIELGKDELFSDTQFDPMGHYHSVQSEPQTGGLVGWGGKVGRNVKFTDNLSGQIFLGAYKWEETKDSFNQRTVAPYSTGVSPYGGMGIKYRLSNEATVNFDWNHFEIQNSSYDQIGIKLHYQF